MMRENLLKEIDRWLAKTEIDYLRVDLVNCLSSELELEDRFYKYLDFGTGGLRGLLGAGTNRMNCYTVAQATQGVANYIKKNELRKSVAIAYDSRRCSRSFAETVAGVLAANEITAFIYPRIEPTPALSFAVRKLKCAVGICITASHNPKDYNGYKVYGSDGCQITLNEAEIIKTEIDKVDVFNDVSIMGFEDGLKSNRVIYIDESILDQYIDEVVEQTIQKGIRSNSLKVVYSPLNGAGRECILRVLKKIGEKDITIVPEQEFPDSNFTTCPYPNPENKEAMQRGIELCQAINADIMLATDPDCDRVGVAVRHFDDCILLSGNEVGLLLFDYICKTRLYNSSMPQNAVAVTTVVSSDMASAIAKEYGVELRRTLTGFKYIGEQIGKLEDVGEEKRFIFGFEESCGYLSGTHVRDKDAVNAVMLICQMAEYHKEEGKDLVQAMEALYNQYGWYKNSLLGFSYTGATGMQKMGNIMEQLRTNIPRQIAGFNVEKALDYKEGVSGLPKSDMLEYILAFGHKVIIRPSGTEPKIKVYITAVGRNEKDAISADEKLMNGSQMLLK